MSKEKYKYFKVRKPVKFTGNQELYFVNEAGMKGLELFAMFRPKSGKGWKIYHFRKIINP